MSGIPLHLWTVKNLKSIGGRLGHVDTDSIQVAEGRMLIDIDSRLPLKFTKKVKAPEGEEVTIQIKYEMLFKHCSTCGSLTHEKGYCPLTVQALVGTNPTVRTDVFARVQIPQEQLNHQPSQGGNKNSNDRSHMSHDMRSRLAGYKGSYAVRGELTDNKHGRDEYRSWHGKETYQPRHQNVNRHADRIVRTRDDISNRYGNSRSRYGPYDRKKDLTWREKQRENKPCKKDNDSLPHEPNSIGNSRHVSKERGAFRGMSAFSSSVQLITSSMWATLSCKASIPTTMANSYTVLANLKAGRCSNTVRVLRFKEAPNVKIGVELMSVDILFLKKILLRFDYRTKLIQYFSGSQLHLEAFLGDWEPTKDSFLVVRALGMSL
ncbi:hypothetical protein F2Q68_00021356 [Brassica cretica]|uniref:Zinc knuckle CX2CX4HX4C domain-containing protein n=1 Tax=Brassica cretica TaxID=69181 RepID=A0A8S9FYD6_BRACR|nr:hypothetical protein F2Q68_00021356 [Brassica cretica]